MKYEKELGVDFDIALSEDHIRKKEKRYISMKRQKQHKQRLLYELSHCTGSFKRIPVSDPELLIMFRSMIMIRNHSVK